ncbi:MAG TPA: hypothetical protein VM327_02715 [Candidatus Thermoplasmatota archaeon]|nr:hypothetical protein [Candidatus Thermoplasmatota archaeon]
MGTSTNQIVGIIFIVLGIILLLGWLNIPYLGTIVGIILIVLGVMALMGAGPMSKNVVLGAVLLVLGILCIIPRLGIGGAIGSLILTIVAVVLIVVGILKVANKM